MQYADGRRRSAPLLETLRRTTTSALLPAAALAVAVAALPAATAAAPVFVVNSDDDRAPDGCDAWHCNLREAIEAANAAGGAEVRFALPAFPYRIAPAAPLPPLEGRVVLDGTSQEPAECPTPVVQIDGSEIPPEEAANGLELLGDGNRIRGLVVTNFAGHGIVVDGNQNRLDCLFVGLGATGTQPAGNGGHGIAVIGGHSNRIGGEMAALGNWLSANRGQGLYIEDALNTLRGHNSIGVDVLGSPRYPNANEDLARIKPPPPLPKANARAVVQIERVAGNQVRSIFESNSSVLEEADLYERYLALLGEDAAGAAPPADLSELIVALAASPDLYAPFIQEVDALLAVAREQAVTELTRMIRTFRNPLPSFGSDALRVPEDRQDVLALTLADLPADRYVVSGAPNDTVAAEGDPDPIANALRWHSLATYGPAGLDASLDNLPVQLTCLGETSPCIWPVAYEFMPFTVQLLWESPVFTEAQIQDVVLENGYLLDLRVNGQLLYKGPPPGTLGADPQVVEQQGWYAATVPGAPCPSGRQCIATNVLARKVLAHVPQPWTFRLSVARITPLATPVIIGIDEFGNPIIATHETRLLGQASRVVLANETAGQHWFTEALYPTFQHPRCTDCHGMSDFAGLAAHHGFAGNVQQFVDYHFVHLEPSLYVPGAHVMACDNCHTSYLPYTDGNGHPFHELDWISPYQDLDVNWGVMNAAQICSRVKTNLPTQQLRHQHFHGDARLFWAIEAPKVPGKTLPAAPPFDFSDFLRRVDLWNFFGAPCP